MPFCSKRLKGKRRERESARLKRPGRVSRFLALVFTGCLLTSQSWLQAGGRGLQSGPAPDSPQCCCCRSTWADRSRTPGCTAGRRRYRLDLRAAQISGSQSERCTPGGGASPEQARSLLRSSARLRPLSDGGELHWAYRPRDDLCRNHGDSQAR